MKPTWRLVFIAAAALSLARAPRAAAHTASTAWVTLSVSNQVVSGRWEISLRDLEDALGLDANDDGQITWGELRARHADIARFALPRLNLTADGEALSLQVGGHAVADRTDNPCEVLSFVARAGRPIRELSVDYRFLFDRDPLHRGLISLSVGGGPPGAAVIVSPNSPETRFKIAQGTADAGFLRFVREGMRHIWTGYDHLLFLLALLLPAVLSRREGEWRPQRSFGAALGRVLQVVTAFTVAHSVTLALAAFEIVRLPTRVVESSIAASIGVAAIANLCPPTARASGGSDGWFKHWVMAMAARPWVMPFVFGWIHGFGFAGALSELGLRRGALAAPLLGFNAGVEIGQLACVAVFLPAAFAIRGSRLYRFGALPAGSMAILALAGGWFMERAFDWRVFPF